MKYAELFPRKSASTKDRGGLTQAKFDVIEKQFLEFIKPVRDRADVYFREFTINGKERYWLMANESVEDLSVERMEYVLKYGKFFLTEISKCEPDDVPM